MRSPNGIYDFLAIAAAAAAFVAMVFVAWHGLLLHRLRRTQKVVLGDSERDVVRHAADLQREFVALRDWIDENSAAIDLRMAVAEKRLDGSVAHTAMIRYDAYGELTGRQSSSVALVDDTGTGVIITAIRHRAHSHLYVKQLRDGDSDIELSPEESEVLKKAFAENPTVAPATAAAPQPPRGPASQSQAQVQSPLRSQAQAQPPSEPPPRSQAPAQSVQVQNTSPSVLPNAASPEVAPAEAAAVKGANNT